MWLTLFFYFVFYCFKLLAGAKVNELTKHRQTALHLAAQQDLATICSVLLENGVDFAAEDENGNNGSLLLLFGLFLCNFGMLLFQMLIFSLKYVNKVTVRLVIQKAKLHLYV